MLPLFLSLSLFLLGVSDACLPVQPSEEIECPTAPLAKPRPANPEAPAEYVDMMGPTETDGEKVYSCEFAMKSEIDTVSSAELSLVCKPNTGLYVVRDKDGKERALKPGATYYCAEKFTCGKCRTTVEPSYANRVNFDDQIGLAEDGTTCSYMCKNGFGTLTSKDNKAQGTITCDAIKDMPKFADGTDVVNDGANEWRCAKCAQDCDLGAAAGSCPTRVECIEPMDFPTACTYNCPEGYTTYYIDANGEPKITTQTDLVCENRQFVGINDFAMGMQCRKEKDSGSTEAPKGTTCPDVTEIGPASYMGDDGNHGAIRYSTNSDRQLVVTCETGALYYPGIPDDTPGAVAELRCTDNVWDQGATGATCIEDSIATKLCREYFFTSEVGLVSECKNGRCRLYCENGKMITYSATSNGGTKTVQEAYCENGLITEPNNMEEAGPNVTNECEA